MKLEGQVLFEGIDSWNRPVFKHTEKKYRYCALDILFDRDTSESDVLEKVSEKDLVYKGFKFESEPMGCSCNVEIIRREK